MSGKLPVSCCQHTSIQASPGLKWLVSQQRGTGEEVMKLCKFSMNTSRKGWSEGHAPPCRPPTCPTLEALTLLEDGEIVDDESAMAGSDNRLYWNWYFDHRGEDRHVLLCIFKHPPCYFYSLWSILFLLWYLWCPIKYNKRYFYFSLVLHIWKHGGKAF